MYLENIPPCTKCFASSNACCNCNYRIEKKNPFLAFLAFFRYFNRHMETLYEFLRMNGIVYLVHNLEKNLFSVELQKFPLWKCVPIKKWLPFVYISCFHWAIQMIAHILPSNFCLTLQNMRNMLSLGSLTYQKRRILFKFNQLHRFDCKLISNYTFEWRKFGNSYCFMWSNMTNKFSYVNIVGINFKVKLMFDNQCHVEQQSYENE